MSFDPRRLGASARELEDGQQRQRAEQLRQRDLIAQNREAAARYARRGRDQARKDFLKDGGLLSSAVPQTGGVAPDAEMPT